MVALSSSSLQIADLFKGDLQLTSPPNIYFELQRVIEDSNKSFIDLGLIIENDPSLSIRILKIVNSAFYNFPAQIASITRAISLIGNKELQNMVLATVVIDRFSSQPGGLLSMHDFWARSLRCALLSRALSIYKQIDHDIESIFVCGLLHDIGQLVIYRRIPILAREVGLYIEANSADEVLTERNIIGFDHFEVGAELSRYWGLPKIIIDSMAYHSDLTYADENSKVVDVVRMANKICKLDLKHHDPFDLCDDIPVDKLAEIIDKTYDQFEQIFKIFYPN
jgi:putative nucleotidyltransferase with HDIG domain